MGKQQGGYRFEKGVIILQRELTELDLFVKKFLNVLKKHSNYLVVSGFVSISTGRTRGTEDVDVLIPVMEKSNFMELFADLKKNGFWCYQGDDWKTTYNYIENLSSLRFARNNEIFPNIEFVPFNSSKKAKSFEFSNPQIIRIKDFEFKIPPLEFEILYKEIVLSGKKDIDDARHLRAVFCDILKKERFNKYEPIIRSELK